MSYHQGLDADLQAPDIASAPVAAAPSRVSGLLVVGLIAGGYALYRLVRRRRKG